MSTTFTVPKYTAEAKRFTGEITGGNYVWKATLDWKAAPVRDAGLNTRTAGREKGPAVINAASESALHAELRRLDSSVKFVKAQSSKSKLGGTTVAATDSDTKILESMRLDPEVSNAAYCNAARQLGRQPQPRPDFTAAPVTVDRSPYTETETGELNHAFLRIFLDKQHPELKENGHEAFNREILLN